MVQSVQPTNTTSTVTTMGVAAIFAGIFRVSARRALRARRKPSPAALFAVVSVKTICLRCEVCGQSFRPAAGSDYEDNFSLVRTLDQAGIALNVIIDGDRIVVDELLGQIVELSHRIAGQGGFTRWQQPIVEQLERLAHASIGLTQIDVGPDRHRT